MTTSEEKPNILRSIAAWSVHLFTATGAIWGVLGIIAIFEQNWRMLIIWMIVAMLVDGFDGMLARWANVKKYADGIDGALLDNILDYLNYVVVPALFIIKSPEILPQGFQYPVAFVILLTSAYQFTQVDAKTDESNEYFFKGFPCYWNVVALYMLVMQLNPWINLAFLVSFNILIFVPVKYVYPTRSAYLKKVTLAFSYLYGAVGIWGLVQYPNSPKWVAWASFIYVAYYAVLSFLPKREKADA